VLVTTGWKLVGAGLAVLVVGVGMYLVRARLVREWPFLAE